MRKNSGDIGESSQQKRQCSLTNKISSTEYVIEDVLLLSTVESPAFRKLIGGIPSVKAPDRKSFTLRLNKAFDGIKRNSKQL